MYRPHPTPGYQVAGQSCSEFGRRLPSSHWSLVDRYRRRGHGPSHLQCQNLLPTLLSWSPRRILLPSAHEGSSCLVSFEPIEQDQVQFRSKRKFCSVSKEWRGVSSRVHTLLDRPLAGSRLWRERGTSCVSVQSWCSLQTGVPGVAFLHVVHRYYLGLSCHSQCLCARLTKLECWAQWFCTENCKPMCSVQGLCTLPPVGK